MKFFLGFQNLSDLDEIHMINEKPLGIIPAGSTDTVAYCLNGTCDVRTITINIALGQVQKIVSFFILRNNKSIIVRFELSGPIKSAVLVKKSLCYANKIMNFPFIVKRSYTFWIERSERC